MDTQNNTASQLDLNKLTFAGLIVTLGIIYGDIGTSPLYVMSAIINKSIITKELVFGAVSCVFWTLTLQTTLKYVIITLQADNNGEGGIFSLYTLVRRKADWLIFVAIIGGATLLADGIITPPISVCSAVEGLRQINPSIPTVPIVIVIILLIFLFQQFGTSIVGKAFGPVMLIWFSMLGILGMMNIMYNPDILHAFNPIYAYNLLVDRPGGFALLGAVFLCTTGAEALYSDLGHCGKKNIRVSWIFVKICLLLNYAGQGAWLMLHEGSTLQGNPFYLIMPQSFLYIGIFIATFAAIIASQALISGSFTLVAEAIRLNLMPKLQVKYPTVMKGQLYIPTVNLMLCLGCIGVVLYFQESINMEGAYGLAITITMLATTILLVFYLQKMHVPTAIIAFFALVYGLIEGAFLYANLQKILHGGYVTILLAGSLIFVMIVKLRAYQIKRRLTIYVRIKDHLPQLVALSHDMSVPKYATNLVYLTEARRNSDVEQKIMYSILQKQPKRADIYWFVNIEVTEEPYTMQYKVKSIAENDVISVKLKLGFRVQQRVNLFLRQVVEDLLRNKEISYEQKAYYADGNITGDFRFIIVDEVLSKENQLSFWEEVIMNSYMTIKSLTASPEKWFGLETSLVEVERAPLVIRPMQIDRLERVNWESN